LRLFFALIHQMRGWIDRRREQSHDSQSDDQFDDCKTPGESRRSDARSPDQQIGRYCCGSVQGVDVIASGVA
jgi:hypothetical protein